MILHCIMRGTQMKFLEKSTDSTPLWAQNTLKTKNAILAFLVFRSKQFVWTLESTSQQKF